MPGLYKRKRPTLTLNSSSVGGPNDNNTAPSSPEVWHSTAIDRSNTSASAAGGGISTSSRSNILEEDDDNLLSLSPVKRPTLGDGVLHLHPTPHRDNNDKDAQEEEEEENNYSENLSSPPGPSSISVMRTPSAAVNFNLMPDDDDDEDDDLFLGLENMAEGQKEQEEEEPTAVAERQQTPPPQQVAVASTLPCRSRTPSPQPQPLPPPATFPRPTASGRSQPLDKSIHLSQRFGPVAIHPPSGHSYFASTIHSAGFVLTLPKNHMYNDVLTFRTKMDTWMEDNTNEHSRIEDNATKFVKALKKYFGSKPNLIHSCTTTLNDRECIQPSLLACLLGVANLQQCLLEVILPALSEATFSNAQDDVDFVSTIVNQMKWLPLLVDGEKFANDLLTILETAGIHSKKHLVRLLPEIFLPEYHPSLVPKLMEIFDEGTPVNVTMLDCFSCLVVPEQECIRIRSSAVEQMSSAPLEELPAYFSFIFRVGNPEQQLEEGIREMREKLEIKPKKRIPQEDAFMIEILERIRFFVSVNPAIIKLWLFHIKQDLTLEIDLPTIDLLMLLIFAETSHKGSLTTLTTIFSRPNLAIPLFEKMMQNNKQMLYELFPTIARFLDSVLRTKTTKCHDAAAEITTKLFVGLGPALSQHLTSNLLGVLINGHSICRDVVLRIFTSIAEIDAPKLLYFSSYLMGALVYVIKYPPRQMQALMNILAILAYMPENRLGEENSFTAEFMILLRKQITHGNIRTRCFGVLGTIAAVRQLALNSNEENDSKIDGLLALAWSSIENDEEACSIFFDEMITCINVLPKDVSIQFRDILKMQFERLWTLDQSSNDSTLLSSGRGQADLALVPTFDGNKELAAEEDGGNVQLIIITLEPHALQMSPLVVPSHLRVMAELEKASEEGNLEGIDSLIGCPVFFPKLSTYYEQKNLEGLNYNQRYHLGQYLMITLNYFRECVSAFVESDNSELRVKVWMRLKNIATLQKSLVKHYESFPNLPSAYGTDMTGSNDHQGPSTSAGFSGGLIQGRKPPAPKKRKVTKPKKKPAAPKKKAAPKKGGKAGSKKKGKKKNSTDEDEEADDDGDEDVSESEETDEQGHDNTLLPLNKETTDLEKRIQPAFITSYIRRLDPKVFSILISFPLNPELDKDPLDYAEILANLSTATQSRATMKRIQQFSPETLTLLLAEMKRQASDKNYDFKLLSVDNLLASLCRHVDTISAFYAEESSQQIDEDGEPETRMHSPPLDSTLRLIFKLSNLYFETVAKVEKVKRVQLVEGMITTIYSQANKNNSEAEPTEEQILIDVAKYLLDFSGFVGGEDYETGLEHVTLMKTFHDLIPKNEKMKKAIGSVIQFYLKRDWKLPSSAITSFLKTWFSVTNSQLRVAQGLAKHLFKESNDSDDEEEEEDAEEDADKKKGGIPNTTVYKSCNKINFPTWYSTMFAALAQHVQIMGRKKANLDFDELIKQWKDGNDLFQSLVHVASKLKKAPILSPLLRFSRVYVQAFITNGVALLPKLWKQDDFDEAQRFLKTLQSSTRKIQAICAHSKIVKDNVLIKNVPILKKTLETLIFKVREIVGEQGGTGAFWMGALKHRDLDGKLIESQPDDEEEEQEEAEEEQVEEEENEEQIDVEEEEETQESNTVDLDAKAEQDEADEVRWSERYLGTDDEDDSDSD